MNHIILSLLQISRPGLWGICIWLYLIPTAGNGNVFYTSSFWVGFLYCTFPLNLLVFAWNDLSDTTTDKVNPRKGKLWSLFGAKATRRTLINSLSIAFLLQLPFLVYFTTIVGISRIMQWFTAVCIVNYTYNNVGTSSIAPLDLVTPMGYLLVIGLSSMINKSRSISNYAWCYITFFVIRSQLWGELFDFSSDSASGRMFLLFISNFFFGNLYFQHLNFRYILQSNCSNIFVILYYCAYNFKSQMLYFFTVPNSFEFDIYILWHMINNGGVSWSLYVFI